VVVDDTQAYLLTVTEHGFGKRTHLEQYRQQFRGGKGIINLKPSSKTGPVLGAKLVHEDEQIIMLTSGNKMIRFEVGDVAVYSRAAQGVKLVNMEQGREVVCFDCIQQEG
jgi:DNA gyrase subunit A